MSIVIKGDTVGCAIYSRDSASLQLLEDAAIEGYSSKVRTQNVILDREAATDRQRANANTATDSSSTLGPSRTGTGTGSEVESASEYLPPHEAKGEEHTKSLMLKDLVGLSEAREWHRSQHLGRARSS
mgnify:FL=1|jgi:hypothetical protein